MIVGTMGSITNVGMRKTNPEKNNLYRNRFAFGTGLYATSSCFLSTNLAGLPSQILFLGMVSPNPKQDKSFSSLPSSTTHPPFTMQLVPIWQLSSSVILLNLISPSSTHTLFRITLALMVTFFPIVIRSGDPNPKLLN